MQTQGNQPRHAQYHSDQPWSRSTERVGGRSPPGFGRGTASWGDPCGLRHVGFASAQHSNAACGAPAPGLPQHPPQQEPHRRRRGDGTPCWRGGSTHRGPKNAFRQRQSCDRPAKREGTLTGTHECLFRAQYSHFLCIIFFLAGPRKIAPWQTRSATSARSLRWHRECLRFGPSFASRRRQRYTISTKVTRLSGKAEAHGKRMTCSAKCLTIGPTMVRVAIIHLSSIMRNEGGKAASFVSGGRLFPCFPTRV